MQQASHNSLLCSSHLNSARESFYLNDAGPAPELLVLGDSGCHTPGPVLVGSILFLLSGKQVMKMIMALNVQESGCVKYIKRPGAVLEAGCVVAKLELDDPSKVRPVCSTSNGHPDWLRYARDLCLFREPRQLEAPGSPASMYPSSQCDGCRNMSSFVQIPLSGSSACL